MRNFLLRAFLPGPATGAGLAAFVATLARPNNPDMLWHLAVGRWIITNHSIPDISRFYYSSTAGFGCDYSWLSQALLYAAWRWLGGAGIAILTSATAGFTLYFLYRVLERNSANLLANFALLGAILTTMAGYLSGRPAMFTVAFLALEMFLLSEFIGSRRRLIWLLPPVVALWTNLHPGFLVAPLVLVLFLPLAQDSRARWTLAACLAATSAAVYLNPYGWRMYLLPVETARSLPMLNGLSEWRSVSGWETVVWGCLVALVTWGLTLRRQPVPVMLLAALSAAAAGLSSRNLPLFGVVAVFVLGRTLLPALSPVLGRNPLLRRFDVKLTTGGWFWLAAVPSALVILTRLGLAPANLELDFSRYPAAAVRSARDPDCPDNLFVREIWSGYLLWTAPDRKLFYDAKGGFSPEAAEAHTELVRPGDDWRGVADRYGIGTFLLERGSPLAVVLREAPGWREEYADSLAAVFVRETDGRARTTGRRQDPEWTAMRTPVRRTEEQ